MQRRQFLRQLGAVGGAAAAGVAVGRQPGLDSASAATLRPASRSGAAPGEPDGGGAAVRAVLTSADANGTPVVYVPAPTGNATTDTANIQKAINGSVTGSIVLFSPTTGGHPYVVNQPIVLLAQRTYLGAERTSTVIQAAAGSDLAAVLVGQAWWENWTVAGLPFSLENLTLDGNSANNTAANGGHGLIFQNYRAYINNVFVQNTPGSGIVLADANKSGQIITNSVIENRIINCTVTSPKQYGIWVQDHDTSGKATDGYLQRCVVENPTNTAVKIDRSSGWFVTENHVYTCQGNGFTLDEWWCTYCYDNEVDGFGLAGASGATYYGIMIENVIYDRPGELHNNIVATQENTKASSYIYYYAHLATGIAATLVSRDNVAYRDDPFESPAAHSVGFLYNAISPDTFTINGHLSNLSMGPTTALSTTGGGNFTFDDPIPSHAASHAAGGSDPLLLAGIASTFAPGLAASGAMNPGENAALFAMFQSWGVSTSKLRVAVNKSSGNISVGIYASTSSGTSRVPSTRRATSGAVPCPGIGMATVSVGSSAVTVDQWDFAAVSIDNNTATVGGTTAANVLMTAGVAAYAVASHPLPATSDPSNGSTQVPWVATP